MYNNLLGDIRNIDAEYVDQDVVGDGDLVTVRVGDHCNVFAKNIIELIDKK